MNKMKKAAFAVCTGLAACAISGCASAPRAELAAAHEAPAVELQVTRPLQSYGTMGGYRYRRFAAVAASS